MPIKLEDIPESSTCINRLPPFDKLPRSLYSIGPFCSSPSILPTQPACSLIEVRLYYFVFTSLPLKPVRFRLELRRKLFGIFLRFLIGVDIEVQEILVESADVFPDGF